MNIRAVADGSLSLEPFLPIHLPKRDLMIVVATAVATYLLTVAPVLRGRVVICASGAFISYMIFKIYLLAHDDIHHRMGNLKTHVTQLITQAVSPSNSQTEDWEYVSAN